MEHKNLWITIFRTWNHFNWNTSEDKKVEISARSIHDLVSRIDEKVEHPYGYSSIEEVQKAMDYLVDEGVLLKVSDDNYLASMTIGLDQNFPAEYIKAGSSVLGSWYQKWKKEE